ncbi:cation diffusion facilitator family transporter [bacterium]|nr:cation diffusion facilitator family transporter [bacterium]
MEHGQLRRKTNVAILSVASNAVLVLLKLGVGLSIGAVSIISEALHSAVDLVAAAIALAAVRISGREADEDHPYGHGKYENISGAVEALLIFVAAAWIIVEAVHRLMKPAPLEAVGWGVAVMVVSAAANTIVSAMLFRVGRETDSLALQADAWHLRTDVYTSAGVMVGLGLIWGGKTLFPHAAIEWLDPVAAIGVALLIIRAAWRLTSEAVRGLLDTGLDRDERDWVAEYLRALVPRVCGYHHLHTRKGGATRYIEMHLIVDPALSLSAAHHLTDEVMAALREHFPGVHVTIHTEPCGEDCDELCQAGCFLPPDQRRTAREAI